VGKVEKGSGEVNIVKETFWNLDRTRTVEVFQRDDHTYGFMEWRFWEDEKAWVPEGRYSHAIIDTLEHAIREAQERVRWLSEAQGE
jgi:hypothetical protein